MSDAESFKIQINEGPVRDFTIGTGKYVYAALAAVLADDDLLPLPSKPEEAILVKIWCERLVPQYGPYRYLIHEDAYQRIHVAHAVANAEPEPQHAG